jgi:hypothetical protein
VALRTTGLNCFDFWSYQSIEVLSSAAIEVPESLSGLGKAYRVRFALRRSDPQAWARTPEFQYVFTKIGLTAHPLPATEEQTMFFQNGRWSTEREALLALNIAAAALRPELKEQAEQARAQLAADATNRRAARFAGFTPIALRERLMREPLRQQTAPCFEMAIHLADLAPGFRKRDIAQSFVVYEQERRHGARYEQSIAVVQRLEKAGLLRAEAFDGEPFPGGRKGKGVKYVLSDAAAADLKPPRNSCLPLGEAKIEELRITPPAEHGTGFRAWARLEQPRPWTAALAAQFPSVRSVLEHGFGILGTFAPGEDGALRVQVQLPVFALKPAARTPRLEPVVAKTGPAFIDHVPGPVRMQGHGCPISADGTEVSACSHARASRGFRSGKAYAEITFQGKPGAVRPGTWTNAAVTTARSLSAVSSGAALFSFAGTYNKHLLKSGDVISIALDMDEQVLYWQLNGKWMTGRPGSGLGEPMVPVNEEHFIAVSAQDKAEAWRVNFGGAPFRYPPPAGFPAYAAAR